MFKELYLKDLRNYLADRRMLYLLTIVFLTMLIVGVVFIGNYRDSKRLYEEYIHKIVDNWLE
jgi:hypothetical protein